MFETVLVTALLGATACTVAVLATVRQMAPMTAEEAKVIWTLHKKTSLCKGRRPILIRKKKDKIVGFRCDCGYCYTQERPLLLKSMKNDNGDVKNMSPFSF
jgi:hypothetical protein